ncbi:IS66-like element accessory protein TnpA [Belnapia moabensis]|uniref:IS66-like element accessory protein TnpA n=1 Tax=Belnapia moabensis TaxID=365533 RepID=UPI0005B83A41|nr:transposase [Belnapia moabensis]
MEIISGVERRRRWRVEDKLRIVAEAERPGARFADVARRYEVSRSVLWMWRKQARSGALVAEQAPVFLPVQIVPEPPVMSGSSSAVSPRSPALCGAGSDHEASQVEIVLPDGTALRVPETIGAPALRRLLLALRR